MDPAGGNAVATKVEPGIAGIFSAVIWHPSSPLRAIRSHVPQAKVTFDEGTDVNAAAQAAKASDVAIVFVNKHMHEGRRCADTGAYRNGQDALVDAVGGGESAHDRRVGDGRRC